MKSISDAEEEVKKLEMREVAKKELEDWYTNHEEQISKTKAANRFVYVSIFDYLHLNISLKNIIF